MFESVFVGFLARKVASRPDSLARAPIDDVCSVSECISPGTPDQLLHHTHNSAGFYDTEAAAWSVVPETERDAYTLFAYRALCVRFDGVSCAQWSPAEEWPGLPVNADLSAYTPVGYDIVNASFGEWFECSPLSCSGIANEQVVNRHCLVDDVDAAIELARLFARDDASVEPGPYHVVEVLRRAGGDQLPAALSVWSSS